MNLHGTWHNLSVIFRIFDAEKVPSRIELFIDKRSQRSYEYISIKLKEKGNRIAHEKRDDNNREETQKFIQYIELGESVSGGMLLEKLLNAFDELRNFHPSYLTWALRPYRVLPRSSLVLIAY